MFKRHTKLTAEAFSEAATYSDQSKNNKVLIVTDCEEDKLEISGILGENYELVFASGTDSAIKVCSCNAEIVRLVVLDLQKSPSDQYEFLKRCRENDVLRHVPVLVALKNYSEDSEIRALENGAAGIVLKPYHKSVLMHRVGSIINLHESVSIIRALENDRLTGLHTKEFFYRKIRAILSQNPDIQYDIICCDIEKFKLINDMFGVAAGDMILCETAGMIKRLVGEGAVCSRLGADTFAALVEHRDDFSEADCAEAVRRINRRTIPTNISVKFGIYSIEDKSLPASQMCDRAVIAVRSIKDRYGVILAAYDDSIRCRMLMEQALVENMEFALEGHQFVVHFQPKYNIRNDKIAGAEALVRWQHPEKGLIYPAEFIPLFERNGFIYKLDRYVWEEACAHMKKWRDMGLEPVPVSVNVSRLDLYQTDLADMLGETVKKYELEPQNLHLEITESAYTDNPRQIIEAVNALRERGFVIEMDDFGTGYSSLNMLSELPIDVLKLDISFIQNETETVSHKNIFSFIISLAKWLDLLVIAEGVETQEQIDKLRSMDCDYVQGYYFSRPVPAEDFQRMIKTSEIDDSDKLKAQVNNPLTPEIILTQRSSSQQTVLIVDDDEAYRAALKAILSPEYSVVEAENGVAAMKYINYRCKDIAAVLLDLVMPVMDGYKLLSIMKNDERMKNIPVIITAEDSECGEESALETGADDFIRKPYSAQIVKHHMRNTIDSAALRVQQRYLESRQKLLQSAYTDYLTGLLNKRGLEEAWSNLPETCLDLFCLIMIDIDNFGEYNDSFGREAGDEILKTFSRTLQSRLRSDDIIARTGGDEFVIIAPDMVTAENAMKKAGQLREAATIPCSVGVVMFEKKPPQVEDVCVRAEQSVIRAKQEGKNRSCMWVN
jgi:diguanylate cyclase (GGDEF)-like protein